ncbi:MAG TPA: hypothetical protein VKR22_05165 [Acidimicrobiales bacterium]|nr:hypothetical protein [Acidimicrobiales bacterium]
MTEVLVNSPQLLSSEYPPKLDPVHAFALRLDAYRRQVEHEDELINHRISWLVSSAAFLFAALALISTSKAADGPLSSTGFRWVLLILVQALGLSMAVLVQIAVAAAHGRLNKLHLDFISQHEQDPTASEFPSVTCDDIRGNPNHSQLRRGRVPATWIPPLLGCAWIATLIASIVVT